MNRYTYLTLCFLAFGGMSASAQLSLGYYKFKDGSEYTGELKASAPTVKEKPCLKMETYTKENM